MTVKEASENPKKSISDYCRVCVNACVCEENQCEFCAVNHVYEMAEKDLSTNN